MNSKIDQHQIRSIYQKFVLISQILCPIKQFHSKWNEGSIYLNQTAVYSNIAAARTDKLFEINTFQKSMKIMEDVNLLFILLCRE